MTRADKELAHKFKAVSDARGLIWTKGFKDLARTIQLVQHGREPETRLAPFGLASKDGSKNGR